MKTSVGSKRIRYALAIAVVFVCGWLATTVALNHDNLSYNRESIAAAAGATTTGSTGSPATPEETAESSGEPDSSTAPLPPVVNADGISHVKTPEVVRGIYMSQCVAGAPQLRAGLVKFVEDSSLNAIVVDIKDFSGGIAFPTNDPLLSKNVSHECGAYDMKDFVASLHQKGIYVVGRITVFQDPTYTKQHPTEAVQSSKGGVWKNNGGLSFVDVGAKPFWDYIVRLSQVSYAQMGFDELNFDYIRYPSDGPLSEAVYTHSKDKTRTEALEEFYKYLHAELQPSGSEIGTNAPVISADMFGMVSSHSDDLGIGQVLESAFPHFDYIYPMIYPSHYPKGFDGYQNVNAHSSDIVYNESKAAAERAVAAGYAASKIRPWLQSFDYPVAYTPAMVKGEIDAAKRGGLDSYVFWDAANKYLSLKQVLQ